MELTVASLNLHCGLDDTGAPFSVKEAVAALDTDVILLQENWRPEGVGSIAARAAADCGYAHVAELDMVTGTPLADLEIHDGAVPDETGAWGLAIISRVPFTGTGAVPIGSAPKDVVGDRHAQVAELPGLRLVNVHLTHRLLHGPAQLRRLVAGLGSPRPTLLAGDFNMFRPVIGLARPFRPVVRGRTWPVRRPLVQIDHVLAAPGVRVTDARVLPAGGSDHLPVQVTVHLRPRP
ncbi:MAG: endonuclease/exonuclease/phosphatase family protein [Actinomycetota bacterium]|nr:endonuclease/exonuclease/phosphatase family protein [Actinomycetota bacterium]